MHQWRCGWSTAPYSACDALRAFPFSLAIHAVHGQQVGWGVVASIADSFHRNAAKSVKKNGTRIVRIELILADFSKKDPLLSV